MSSSEAFDGELEAFAAALAARGARPAGIATYVKALRRLAPDLHAVDTAAALLDRLGELAPKSRASYLTAARAWARWRAETGRDGPLRFHDPVRVRLDAPAPRPLDREADRRLLTAAEASRDPRLRLLIPLLRLTGLRIGEARRLRWCDLDLTPGAEAVTVAAPEAKGRRGRSVPILAGRLRAHLARRDPRGRAKDDAARAAAGRLYLFPADRRNTRAWSYAGVRRGFAAVAKRANVTCTIHQLRHTCATEWLRNGMQQDVVRRLLGHVNFNMLKVYCDLTADDLRREMERVSR